MGLAVALPLSVVWARFSMEPAALAADAGLPPGAMPADRQIAPGALLASACAGASRCRVDGGPGCRPPGIRLPE